MKYWVEGFFLALGCVLLAFLIVALKAVDVLDE